MLDPGIHFLDTSQEHLPNSHPHLHLSLTAMHPFTASDPNPNLNLTSSQGEMLRFLVNQNRQYRRWLIARGFRRWITNAAVSTYDRVLDSFLEEVSKTLRKCGLLTGERMGGRLDGGWTKMGHDYWLLQRPHSSVPSP